MLLTSSIKSQRGENFFFIEEEKQICTSKFFDLYKAQ